MKLTKVDWRKTKFYKATKLDEVLDEFLKMHTEVAEITEYEQKTVASVQTCLKAAIKRRRLGGIDVRIREGKVYLINTDLLDKHKED